MDRDFFEHEIERVTTKYEDIDDIVEMSGDNIHFDDVVEEIYINAKDDSNIESMLLDAVNKKIAQEPKTSSRTMLQIYFDDVGQVYKNIADSNIDFCKENREKIIESNLKCVVKIAKKYRNLGIPFEDLISAGNEGLCVAFEKYNPKRAMIRNKLLDMLKDESDNITAEWIKTNIQPLCKYGKNKTKYSKDFNNDIYDKKYVEKWIKSNIKDASFNSVAMLWVNAYIRNEITLNGRLIKKPLSEIYKDKKENKKDTYYDINGHIGGNSDNSILSSVLYIEDDTQNEIDIVDAYKIMHENIKVMFTGLEARYRRIVMQRFGIGIVRPMKPDEIAARENISKARVSQILRYSLDTMRDNCKKYKVDGKLLYNIIQNSKEIF